MHPIGDTKQQLHLPKDNAPVYTRVPMLGGLCILTVPHASVSLNLLLVLQETAASYGLGAVGSLVYLRMLNRSIDSVGGVGAALSQPRLLVPVILTGTFNRCGLESC